MRNIIPVVMAGVLGIYGLIVAVVLIQAGASRSLSLFNCNIFSAQRFSPRLGFTIPANDVGLFPSFSRLQSSRRTRASTALPTSPPVCLAVSLRWPPASLLVLSATPVCARTDSSRNSLSA